MPTALTDGFSLAALVPEAMLSTVFSQTFLQAVPGLISRDAQGAELTMWFRGASLTLEPRPLRFVNPILVQIGFTARLTGQYDEVTGTVVLRTNITQVQVGSGDQAFLAPVVDLRPNALDGFAVVGLTPQQQPVWGVAIAAAMKPKLAAVSPLTAGPLLPDRAAQYFLTTDPATPYGAGDGVLAVHVWSEPGPTPDLPVSLAPRNVRANRAVALVPRDRVDVAIAAGLAANGLTNLPTDVQGVTISAFSIQWREFGLGGGHFYVSGTADHWTGDVDFEAWLRLRAVAGRVQVEVVRTRADTGFLGDVADLFSGGAITRMLEEILPRAVGGIGAGAFGDLGVFATGSLPQAQAFATVTVDGSIDIWKDGLGVPAMLVPVDVTSSFPPPTYLRGHTGTREFHVEGCKYGALIKHPWRFPTWQRAIQLGFNGCWHCQREFNVVAVGRLDVVVAGRGLSAGAARVIARLISAPERFGVVVAPPVEEISGRFGWNEQEQARHHRTEVLVPGTWEVTIAQDDWSVTASAKVGRSWTAGGTRHGTQTVVRTTVGSSDVSVEQIPLES